MTTKCLSRTPITKNYVNLLSKKKKKNSKGDLTVKLPIFKPDNIKEILKCVSNTYVTSRHKTKIIPVTPSIGMGEFFSIMMDGLAWDCANNFGLTTFLLGVIQGGKVLSNQVIGNHNFKSSYRSFNEKVTSLTVDNYKGNHSAERLSHQLTRSVNLRLDYTGIKELAIYIGYDYLLFPEEDYNASLGDNFPLDQTENFLKKSLEWYRPSRYAELLGEGYYTEFVTVGKGSKVHNLNNNVFICVACGCLNSKCDDEVHTCGKCLSINATVEIDVNELKNYKCLVLCPSCYEFDRSINGPLAALSLKNYLDGGLLNLPKLNSELIAQDVLRYVKTRSRLDVKNQYVCANLSRDELNHLREEFKNLEIIVRNTWLDMQGMLMTESHCHLTTLLNSEKKITEVQGFNRSYTNVGSSETKFSGATHLTNWQESTGEIAKNPQVMNYNSIPKMEKLLSMACARKVYLIVPNVFDQYNGFSNGFSFEISNERGLVKILINGTTTVLEYTLEQLKLLLEYDYISCDGKLFEVKLIKKTSNCSLISVSKLKKNSLDINELGYKSIHPNQFKMFTLEIPDWQQNVMGLQLGPMIKRRIKFNMRFLKHLITRCEAWPVSFHGLREYAIVSSFSRSETNDIVKNVFEVNFEDIPDHVFCAYNIYLRQQLSTQFTHWITTERSLGLDKLIQGFAGGIVGLITNLMNDHQNDKSFISQLLGKCSDLSWLVSAQWDKIEDSIKSWETGAVKLAEFNGRIDESQRDVLEMCQHGMEKDLISNGCNCCGRKTNEPSGFCSTCNLEGCCSHPCLHRCNSKIEHFCEGSVTRPDVTIGDKLKCGHTIVNCKCCRKPSCQELCYKCFEWGQYDDNLTRMAVVDQTIYKGEGAESAVKRVIKQARGKQSYPKSIEKKQVTYRKEKSQPNKQPEKGTTTSVIVDKPGDSGEKVQMQITKKQERKYFGVSSDSSEEEANQDPLPTKEVDNKPVEEHEDKSSDEDEPVDDTNVEKLKQHIMINELRAITNDEYCSIICQKAKPMAELIGESVKFKFLYQGEIFIDPTSINSIRPIIVPYAVGFCLRDTLSYYNPIINDISWSDACTDMGLDESWCILNDVWKYAEHFEMNVLVIHEMEGEVAGVYGYVYDKYEQVNMIRYSSGKPGREDYEELRGHYEPCEVGFNKEPCLPPVYAPDITWEDVNQVYSNVTGGGDLGEFYDKNIEDRLTIALALNENKGIKYASSGFPKLELSNRRMGYLVYNNNNNQHEPRKGKLATFIKETTINSQLNIPSLLTRAELQEWCLENLVKEENISNDTECIKNGLVMIISQYLELKMSCEETFNNQNPDNSNISLLRKGIKVVDKGNYSIILALDGLERLKTGDVIMIRRGPNRFCCQVERNIKRIIIPKMPGHGTKLLADIAIFKISYTSLMIQLASMSHPGINLEKAKKLLTEATCILGYPGTGKTKELVKQYSQNSGLLIGVTRGSQESLIQELGSRNKIVFSAERAMTNRASSKTVYIDEASLITLPQLCCMLTPLVEKLVLSGDLAQIPAKEFSKVCGYQPTNILEFGKYAGATTIELKKTWRFGRRICSILNEAFGLDMQSATEKETNVNLEHSCGIDKNSLNRIVRDRNIDTIMVFTTQVERQVNSLLEPESRVKVARVHSSQGSSFERVLIVQDYRKGPAQGSEEVQFQKEYVIVAMTRCRKDVTILCTYESCKCRETSNESIARHLNRDLGLQYLYRGGKSHDIDVMGILNAIQDRVSGLFESVEPNLIKDWLQELWKIATGGIKKKMYMRMATMIKDCDDREVLKTLLDSGMPMVSDVVTENGKLYAMMNYDNTNWNYIKKKTMTLFNSKQLIECVNNKILIGGVEIIGDCGSEEIIVDANKFDSWESTQKHTKPIIIRGYKRKINSENCGNINMNIRLINHSSQLCWNAAKLTLNMEYMGVKYCIKPTTGCSLCGGIQITKQNGELMVFINNMYENYSSRDIQFKSESDPITNYLLGKWDMDPRDGHLWELTAKLLPNVNHNALHYTLWIERILAAIKGIKNGKTFNTQEGHFFRNELELNERILCRYKNIANEAGIKITCESDRNYSYFKNLSFLFPAKFKGNNCYVYFHKHKKCVLVNKTKKFELSSELVPKLWNEELYRLPYSLSLIFGGAEIPIKGHKEVINMLDLDLEKHDHNRSKLMLMIDEDLTKLAKDKNFANPEIAIPSNHIADGKDLGLASNFNIIPDVNLTGVGVSYLFDSIAAKLFSLNLMESGKTFITRYCNLSLRQDIERHIMIKPIDTKITHYKDSEAYQDCFARILSKRNTVSEIAKTSDNPETKTKHTRIEQILQQMLDGRDLSSVVMESNDSCKTNIGCLGVSCLEFGDIEIRKMMKELNCKRLIGFIPDLRNKSIRELVSLNEGHLLFKGDARDYVINPKWAQLINILYSSERWESSMLLENLKIVGQTDLFLVVDVTDTNEITVGKIPASMHNDETVVTVPQLNPINEIRRTGNLFNAVEFVIDNETLSRLVRRAMTPGCTLPMLQTIARNRMQSTVITKSGRRAGGRNVIRDVSLCALVAQYIANHNDNQITRYLEKIDDYLMDNKDWKRSSGALIHMLKLEANTIIGNALNIKVSLSELSKVLGEVAYNVMTDKSNKKGIPGIRVIHQPHRIMYGEYYYHGLDFKNPNSLNLDPNVIGNILRNSFKSWTKNVESKFAGYWAEPSTTNSKLSDHLVPGKEYSVKVLIYDMSGGIGRILQNRLKLSMKTDSVIHSSVCIGDNEISYGNGVRISPLGSQMVGKTSNPVTLGKIKLTAKNMREIDDITDKIFTPHKYSPIGLNCNLFSLWLIIQFGYMTRIKISDSKLEHLENLASLVPEFGSKVPENVRKYIIALNSKVMGNEELTTKIMKCFEYTVKSERPTGNNKLNNFIAHQLTILTGRNLTELRMQILEDDESESDSLEDYSSHDDDSDGDDDQNEGSNYETETDDTDDGITGDGSISNDPLGQLGQEEDISRKEEDQESDFESANSTDVEENEDPKESVITVTEELRVSNEHSSEQLAEEVPENNDPGSQSEVPTNPEIKTDLEVAPTETNKILEEPAISLDTRTVIEFIKEEMEKLEINKIPTAMATASDAIGKLFSMAEIDPKVELCRNVNDEILNGALNICRQARKDFTVTNEDQRGLMSKKEKIGTYNERLRFKIINKFKKISICVVALGSTGDTLPILSACKMLKLGGAWICLLSHPDIYGLDASNHDKFIKINKSQRRTTGNIKSDSAIDIAKHAQSHNIEALRTFKEATQNHDFDLVLSTPLAPAVTGYSIFLGLRTAEAFCTYCWNTGVEQGNNESDSFLLRWFGFTLKYAAVDGTLQILRQSLATSMLREMSIESPDISTVPRIVLSWDDVHSEKNIKDPKSVFIGYTSPGMKANVLHNDYRFRLLVGFGSMQVREEQIDEISKIARAMSKVEMTVTIHVQDEILNKLLIISMKNLFPKCKILLGNVNLGEVLANNDAMICHGGIGTVQECLMACCVPIIVPCFADQPYVGSNLERNQLGIMVGESETELTAKLKKIPMIQQRIKRKNYSMTDSARNLADSVLDLLESQPPARERKTAKPTTTEQSKVPSGIVIPYLTTPSESTALSLAPGEYQVNGVISEETVYKIGESYYGGECFKDAFNTGVLRLRGNEYHVRATHSTASITIETTSDIPKLNILGFYNHVNIQVLGYSNKTVIFNENWPLLSIYVTRTSERRKENNLHAFIVANRTDLVRIEHVAKTGDKIMSIIDVKSLSSRLSLPIGTDPKKAISSIINCNDELSEWDWKCYGSFENLKNRLKGENIDALLQSDSSLALPVLRTTQYPDGACFEININTRSLIGEVVYCFTTMGIIPGMIVRQSTNKIYVITLQPIIHLSGLIRCRLLRKKTGMIPGAEIDKLMQVSSSYVLNAETINKIKEIIPGSNPKLITATIQEMVTDYVVVATAFDTRSHHSDRSEYERKILIELIGTSKLKLLPNEISENLVAILKLTRVGYYNYAAGCLWYNIECKEKELCLSLASIAQECINKRGSFFNSMLNFRIGVEDTNEFRDFIKIMNNNFDYENNDVIAKTNGNIQEDKIIKINLEWFNDNLVVAENKIAGLVFSEFLGKEKEIDVICQKNIDNVNVNSFQLTSGVCISKSGLTILSLNPLIKITKVKMKGGAEPGKDKTDSEMGRVFNIQPNEVLMDQPLDMVKGPKLGKENFGRYDKWLKQNPHLEEPKVALKGKSIMSTRKFPWEEIYHTIQSDGQLDFDVKNVSRDYVQIDPNENESQFGNLESKVSDPAKGLLENYKVIDLWEGGRDLIDHVVMHGPTNAQRYTVKEGYYSVMEVTKTIFSKYPIQCRPIFQDEAYASLNSLTGRLGRSLEIRNMKTVPATDEVISKMANLFFHKNWEEMTNMYKTDPIVFNEKDFRDWVMGHKNANKVIKELEDLCAEGISTNPFNRFRSHVKLESINKPNAIEDFRQSAPRAIVWLPYCMPALFSYIFKLASNRFKLILRDNVHYASGIDVNDLQNYVNSVEEDCYIFDNDISKMDSQIDKHMIEIEWEVLKLMGVDPEVLESYKELKKNWTISNKFVRVSDSWLRHSGEPTTALGNGIINLAITSLSLSRTKRSDMKLCLFVGDDMLLVTKQKEDIDLVKLRGKKLANSLLKPSINRRCGPFCSFIIGYSDICSGMAVVPNVSRLAFKWEVPNGQHETTDESVFTRQLSYACLLGSNSFSSIVQPLINKQTKCELEIPTYYRESDLIRLNCDYSKLKEMEFTDLLNSLYNRILKPETIQVKFLITSENIRKGIKKMSQVKSSDHEPESKCHVRLTVDAD
ncbi:polyprotein [Geranium carolinianum endornavirus]|nr:polyprotein [Geranium carolinianum endornavirus]